MGDIADMKLNGEMCKECGVCFEKAHGHPVLCAACWSDSTPEVRRTEQTSYYGEL